MHKRYYLEKWKQMRCDFEFHNEICQDICSLCQYYPDINLINCEEAKDIPI